MTSRLLVDKIEGKSTANTIEMPSGYIIHYQSQVASDMVSSSSSTFATCFTYPTYTPKSTTSKIIHRFSMLFRGYNSSSHDSRGKLRVKKNGTIMLVDNEFGNYDYSGSGIWWRYTYSNGTEHTGHNGNDVTVIIEFAALGNNIEFNSDDGSSDTKSFFEIIEIAQ